MRFSTSQDNSEGFVSEGFVSALLSERLMALANDADLAGFPVLTEHLLHLAMELLDEPSGMQASEERWKPVAR